MESVVNDNVMNDDNIINSDGDSYEEDSEVKSENNIVDGDTMTKKKKKSSNSSISNAKGERKKMSYVWDHFKEISDSNNEAKSEKDVVECNYCGKCIAYKPSYRTSGMKNHIARCKRFPANLNRKQKLVDFESKTITSPVGNHGGHPSDGLTSGVGSTAPGGLGLPTAEIPTSVGVTLH
ncbi:hypothetical protein V6N12_067178 [Hibiscus sabdariffa]|uniref:BED-type domain-containing protein n=1 Tax=Hibiscus sabdariffa TaxID=183260 RepID=A0ABR2BUP3_9ROSI